MLPEKYRKWRGAKDMKIGHRGWLRARDLRFDQDERLWVHPLAEEVPGPSMACPKRRDPTRPAIVAFEVVAGKRGRPAFRITIDPVHLGDHRWETPRKSPVPDEACGLRWLAVLAISDASETAEDAVVNWHVRHMGG